MLTHGGLFEMTAVMNEASTLLHVAKSSAADDFHSCIDGFAVRHARAAGNQPSV